MPRGVEYGKRNIQVTPGPASGIETWRQLLNRSLDGPGQTDAARVGTSAAEGIDAATRSLDTTRVVASPCRRGTGADRVLARGVWRLQRVDDLGRRHDDGGERGRPAQQDGAGPLASANVGSHGASLAVRLVGTQVCYRVRESRLAARSFASSERSSAFPTVAAPGSVEPAITLSRCRSVSGWRDPLEFPQAIKPSPSGAMVNQRIHTGLMDRSSANFGDR